MPASLVRANLWHIKKNCAASAHPKQVMYNKPRQLCSRVRDWSQFMTIYLWLTSKCFLETGLKLVGHFSPVSTCVRNEKEIHSRMTEPIHQLSIIHRWALINSSYNLMIKSGIFLIVACWFQHQYGREVVVIKLELHMHWGDGVFLATSGASIDYRFRSIAGRNGVFPRFLTCSTESMHCVG